MNAPAKIMWAEGLALAPQHFQQQDLYHERRLHRVTAALQPHLWGVRALRWNEEALGHNSLSPEVLELILPDGEVVDAPAHDPLPPALDLTRIPLDVHAVIIHAALPMLTPHSGNVGAHARYASAQTEAHDLFSGALPSEVCTLRKQLRLLPEQDPRDGCVSVPVARLLRQSQGGFALDRAFVPPALSIAAAPPLKLMLDHLISALTSKIESLHQAHRKSHAGTYEAHAGDIASWWMLNVVSTANAWLLHCARAQTQHPEALYERLLALAAGLMTFSDRYVATDLPPYVHADPGPAFARLDTIIRELADTVISARYFAIALEQDPQRRTWYRAALDPARVTPHVQLCLAVSADMPALELVAAVPLRLKAGAPDDIEQIVASALPGIVLTHMPQVPAAIPVRPDTYYFSVSGRDPLYEKALAAGALVVYAPDGIRQLAMHLVAVQS
ncbi:MAG: type VI secretion system baseplate subunit TssK [Telluria sp.]